MSYPPKLLKHLAEDYSTPPPPQSTVAKFWSIFLPFSTRAHESDRLIWGNDGEGGIHNSNGDIVLDVIRRGGGDYRKKGVDRALEGWINGSGPCELEDLPSLKSIFGQFQPVKEVGILSIYLHLTVLINSITKASPDPTQNISFNLKLTEAQQQSRSKVPLPYAHEGTLTIKLLVVGCII